MTIGGRTATEEATLWRRLFTHCREPETVRMFDARILKVTGPHQGRVGANSVLIAAAHLGLYNGRLTRYYIDKVLR